MAQTLGDLPRVFQRHAALALHNIVGVQNRSQRSRAYILHIFHVKHQIIAVRSQLAHLLFKLAHGNVVYLSAWSNNACSVFLINFDLHC